MPGPIRCLTLAHCAQLLQHAELTRKIECIHVHHTWRPRKRDFRGIETIEAMRRYHMETNGWSDIAQHLTIDPHGGLWTGRNWNRPPASQKGENGTGEKGPFMIEIIGDFDCDAESLEAEQREAVLGFIVHLLHTHGLSKKAVHFHRELGSPKSCPGSGVDAEAFRAEVEQTLAEMPQRSRRRSLKRSPFGVEHLLGYDVIRPTSEPDDPDATVPEGILAGRAIDLRVSNAVSARQASRQWPPTRHAARVERPGPWDRLKPYVINLSKGELSEGGRFRTTPDDLEGILDSISEYVATTDTPRVLLYAHGGLVSEKKALDYALKVHEWWVNKGVYPVFFIWETGLIETLKQYFIGARGPVTAVTDTSLELALKAPGSIVWSMMKRSARRASALDVDDGGAGGALRFAEGLARLLRELPDDSVEVHAAGHSAGSIFHARLLPELQRLGTKIKTLSFLAPAVRVKLFKKKLLPLLNSGDIGKLFMFTMEEDAELQDDVWKIYRKSLLYLVSRSFEGIVWRKILGLQRSIRKDQDLRDLFGIDRQGEFVPGASPAAELQFSYAADGDENPLCKALAHGDFDNDPAAMGAVLRRILGADDATGIGDDFPFELEERGFEMPDPVFLDPRFTPPPNEPITRAPVVRDTGGRHRALCIGIDEYRQRPLAGCVSDARAWGRSLESLGFEVLYLLDQQATRGGIVDAMRELIDTAQQGDVLAIQYSGHGTQLPDLNGDEIDEFDEAYVPIDYDTGAYLIDDDIAEILDRLPDGVLMTLFMDCCHSGTISRFAPALRATVTTTDRARFLPATAELIDAHVAFRSRMGVSGTRSPEQSLRNVIHLAACQDHEYAWESGGQGDFTAAATGLLSAAVSRGDSNEAFLDAVRGEVILRGRQHPMMMAPPSELSNRALLAPLARVPGSSDGKTAGRSDDAELLGHLEAMAAILRARMNVD